MIITVLHRGEDVPEPMAARRVLSVLKSYMEERAGYLLIATECRPQRGLVTCVTPQTGLAGLLHYTAAALASVFKKSDVVVVQGTPLLPLATLAKLLGKKVYVIELGDWPEAAYWRYYAVKGPRLAKAVRNVLSIARRITLAVADKFITNSAEVYIKLRGRPVLKIPKYTPALSTENHTPRRYITYVGRLSPEKGVDRLIRAYLATSMRCPLAIAGNGALKSLVKKAARHPKILYLGYLGPSQLSRLYAETKILVIPSYSEGLPHVLLEAAKAQIPHILIPSRLAIAKIRHPAISTFNDEKDLAAKLDELC